MNVVDMDKTDISGYNAQRKECVPVNQIIYAGKHLLTYSVSRHAHSSWELIYCTGGEGRLYFDGGSLPYQTGDLLIVPPLVFHRNEGEQGFTNIHLNLADAPLKLKTPAIIHDDGNHFLLDAMTAAFYHFSSEPGKQTAVLSAYANLLVCLISAGLDAPARSSVVEEIESTIIRSYPDEGFELDEYLRSLPFNYDYLRKLFKSETGETPHRFLSEIRLQAAAERLGSDSTEDLSISEIAHLCGFHEPLYFSRVFRKKYGLSPSDYQSRAHRKSPVPDAESIKIEL